MELFQTLIAKHVIKTATENSLEYVDTVANAVFRRANYIIKVLRAPYATRLAVKSAIEAGDIGGEPNPSGGQQELWIILAIFEDLSADEKAAFIRDYINTMSVHGNGSVGVALRYVWEQNYEPPVNVP